MKLRVDCPLEDAEDACRALRAWIDGAEAGELDGDEALSGLVSVAELVDAQRIAVVRVLGQ